RQTFAGFLVRPDREPGAWPGLYEDFLQATAPEARRSHGVYFTPSALVGAQVRMVETVLRERFASKEGFADPRVLVVDPATGSGAYPLAVLERVGSRHVNMRLLETMPGAAALARARGLSVVEADALACDIPLDSPIVVCLGNPPYRRRASRSAERAALQDFVDGHSGVHRKNLYNDYVYFWRWALRVVFERRRGAGIVCFVTASSYLRGPAFVGMRRLLRQTLDELWLVDLEGD